MPNSHCLTCFAIFLSIRQWSWLQSVCFLNLLGLRLCFSGSTNIQADFQILVQWSNFSIIILFFISNFCFCSLEDNIQWNLLWCSSIIQSHWKNFFHLKRWVLSCHIQGSWWLQQNESIITASRPSLFKKADSNKKTVCVFDIWPTCDFRERERKKKFLRTERLVDRSQNAKYFFKERVFLGTKDPFLQPNPLREV